MSRSMDTFKKIRHGERFTPWDKFQARLMKNVDAHADVIRQLGFFRIALKQAMGRCLNYPKINFDGPSTDAEGSQRPVFR